MSLVKNTLICSYDHQDVSPPYTHFPRQYETIGLEQTIVARTIIDNIDVVTG